MRPRSEDLLAKRPTVKQVKSAIPREEGLAAATGVSRLAVKAIELPQ